MSLCPGTEGTVTFSSQKEILGGSAGGSRLGIELASHSAFFKGSHARRGPEFSLPSMLRAETAQSLGHQGRSGGRAKLSHVLSTRQLHHPTVPPSHLP